VTGEHLALALFVLLGALGLGFGLLADGDLTRAERRIQALTDEVAEARCAIAARDEDLIEAARRIKRHAIARRNAEERLADCRCHWLADEPTLDLGDGPLGLVAQVERYLAEQGDGS
jgi:hypothetical protein